MRYPWCCWFGLPIAALLLLASGSRGWATTIDFEGFADSTVLSSQISGLTFTNARVLTAGISLNEFEFPPHSGSNVAVDDGGPMTVVFTDSVTNVGGFFTYGKKLTLEAFDAAHLSLGMTHTMFSNNEKLSGEAGSSPNESLSLSVAGTKSVTITGDVVMGGSFALDDLTFTTGPPPSVPEPQTLVLVVCGIAGLAGARLSRSSRSDWRIPFRPGSRTPDYNPLDMNGPRSQ